MESARPASSLILFCYLFVLGVFCLCICARHFTDGMFGDGLIYATVSRNLAEGFGTIWAPQYSTTEFQPYFHEHPPLVFWLQGAAFFAFGDHYLVERVYALAMFFLAGFLIHLLWQESTQESGYSFLPLLLWFLTQSITFALSGNLLENTMTVFVLASLWCQLRFFKSRAHYFLILAAIALVLSFLTKGFTGLFPLIGPSLYWLVYRNSLAKAIRDQILICVYTALPILTLLFVNKEARELLLYWYENQVAFSVSQVKTVTSRFDILFYTLEAHLVPFLVCSLLAGLAYCSRRRWMLIWNREITFFLLVGASGIVPMIISMKQRGFYINAAVPLLSIALALIYLPSGMQVIRMVSRSKIRRAGLIGGSLAVLCSGIAAIAWWWQTPGRDPELLRDLRANAAKMPRGEVVGVNRRGGQIEDAIGLYFARDFRLSLDKDSPFLHDYLVHPAGEEVPPEYETLFVLGRGAVFCKKLK